MSASAGCGIKFCGLTRPEDAAAAVALGATHVGVIFAGGPRLLTEARAAEVLAAVPRHARRVGVFGGQGPAAIASVAAAVGLDVVQLHGAGSAAEVAAVRRQVPDAVDVWAVLRVDGAALPPDYEAILATADAVVVDAFVPGRLGGTGVTADWPALADAFAHRGRPRRLVLAGGLRPENVQEAVRLLAPEVVDVSSGVEAGPGIKDHVRMAAFAAAVHALATALAPALPAGPGDHLTPGSHPTP